MAGVGILVLLLGFIAVFGSVIAGIYLMVALNRRTTPGA
jgi:hypothetical protein